MLALVSFIIVILFSLIVVKIGSVALESTGLSKEISQFQAQSAFSGVGFTTKESEQLMENVVRRKILRFLMLMGSAGLTSAVATLILTFMNTKGSVSFMGYYFSSLVFNISIIVIILSVTYFISKTDSFDKFIRRILQKPLHLVKSKMSLYDYEKILGLSKGNSIISFEVPKRHWIVNKSIGKLKLEKEGVNVLGIFRVVHGSEEYLSSPSDDFIIQNKDKLVVYCKESIVVNLAKREKGRKGSKERKQAEQINKSLDAIKQIHEDSIQEAVKK